MNDKDYARLQELRSKEELTDKEWKQLEYLEKKLENDEKNRTVSEEPERAIFFQKLQSCKSCLGVLQKS